MRAICGIDGFCQLSFRPFGPLRVFRQHSPRPHGRGYELAGLSALKIATALAGEVVTSSHFVAAQPVTDIHRLLAGRFHPIE